MEYTLSTRKSVANDMYYQKGKLYEAYDIHNATNKKWLYWTTWNNFKDADGWVLAGDLVVFLDSASDHYKLLLDNGTVAYVAILGDFILKPVKHLETP